MVEHPNNYFPNQQNNMPNGHEDEMEVADELDLEETEDYENDASFPESEELAAIDIQLDELNTALDSIEQKNDNISAELIQLLNENREIRHQLQQVRLENPDNPENNQHQTDKK